jgi:hypothetical protein
MGKPSGLYLSNGVSVKVVSGSTTYYKMISGDKRFVGTAPEGGIEELYTKRGDE